MNQMARENEDYRATLEQLNRHFPERELLTMEEVMRITGYKSKDSVRKHFPFVNRRINKATLARCLSAQPRKARRKAGYGAERKSVV